MAMIPLQIPGDIGVLKRQLTKSERITVTRLIRGGATPGAAFLFVLDQAGVDVPADIRAKYQSDPLGVGQVDDIPF